MDIVYLITMLVVSITSVCTGVCIVLRRPPYAEPITPVETLVVVFFWWAVLLAMQAGKVRRAW